MSQKDKKIILANGEKAVVDNDDYSFLNQYSWYKNPDGYASTTVAKKHLLMHRVIMETPKGLEVDHINGQKLDNRRINLRNCTRQENGRNINVRKSNKTSLFRGVSLNIKKNKYKYWFAAIKKDGKAIALGTFKNERHAALFYDIASKDLFGEFGNLNFPEGIHG